MGAALSGHFDMVPIPPDYKKKESVRAELQELIMTRVANGDIKSQDDLIAFFATIDMALRALKGVPFEVLSKIDKTPKTVKPKSLKQKSQTAGYMDIISPVKKK